MRSHVRAHAARGVICLGRWSGCSHCILPPALILQASTVMAGSRSTVSPVAEVVELGIFFDGAC